MESFIGVSGSHDHLSHALGDLGSVRTIPPGSQTEYVRPSSRPLRPQFFSDEEFKIVTRVIGILLGRVASRALLQVIQWLDLYLYSAARVREAALSLDPLHRALAVTYYGESAVRRANCNNSTPPSRYRPGLLNVHVDILRGVSRIFADIDLYLEGKKHNEQIRNENGPQDFSDRISGADWGRCRPKGGFVRQDSRG